VIEALKEAAETRLRPILMTTMTMVFGMSPIALSTSAGSEWKSGLAWALIGGLISSLLLTLVLVPVMYVKVNDWRERVPAFFKLLITALEAKRISSTGKSVAPKVVPALEFNESE
jgi:HAE1 family hydrophobic/amphiphilic exporter-1